MQAIWQIFKNSRETYGSPRIHAELLTQGFYCSCPRVAHLMKKAGIMAKMQRLFKTTTRTNAKAVAAPNLLQQDFSAKLPNEKWEIFLQRVRQPSHVFFIAPINYAHPIWRSCRVFHMKVEFLAGPHQPKYLCFDLSKRTR